MKNADNNERGEKKDKELVEQYLLDYPPAIQKDLVEYLELPPKKRRKKSQ